ncbi:MAG: glycoside hydrolase family 11 protein [Clostridiales bacterium]|jgi:endo-1,4-beta-xylanase|nr:glycoside hydrolase family 11 protein [Clostridiales bacterium]
MVYRSFFKRTAAFAVVFVMLFAAFPADFFARTITQTFDRNTRRRVGNWDVELWTQTTNTGPRTMGGVQMDIYDNGTFACSWNQTFNTLFRVGRKFDNNSPRIDSMGDISVMFNAAEHTSTNTSYLTLYGWTRNSLIEWYVVENWITYRPGGNRGSARSGYIHHGTIEVDGGVYDIYTSWRIQQPSIDGTRTFLQIFSVRHGTRTSGTVNLSAHFDAWRNIGEIVDGSNRSHFSATSNLTEISFCVEGFGGQSLSSGSADVDQLCIRYGTNSICTANGCSNCTAGAATPTPAPTVAPTATPAPAVTPAPTPAPVVTPAPPAVTPAPAGEEIMRFTVGSSNYTNRGVSATLDAAPFIDSGRVMVPLRAIAEGLGATITWNDATKTITLVRGGATTNLTIDVPLPDGMGSPVIVEGRTFVPARFVGEVLNATVDWDDVNRAVVIR